MVIHKETAMQYVVVRDGGVISGDDRPTKSFTDFLTKNTATNKFNFSCYAILNTVISSYEWVPVSMMLFLIRITICIKQMLVKENTFLHKIQSQI